MIILNDISHPQCIIVPKMSVKKYKFYSYSMENNVTHQRVILEPIGFEECKDWYLLTFDFGFAADGEYTFYMIGDITDCIFNGLLRVGHLKGNRNNKTVTYNPNKEYITYGA